jgi:hypothetical protein
MTVRHGSAGGVFQFAISTSIWSNSLGLLWLVFTCRHSSVGRNRSWNALQPQLEEIVACRNLAESFHPVTCCHDLLRSVKASPQLFYGLCTRPLARGLLFGHKGSMSEVRVPPTARIALVTAKRPGCRPAWIASLRRVNTNDIRKALDQLPDLRRVNDSPT